MCRTPGPLRRWAATAERQIYVSTNATLRLAERNTFGGAETTNLKAEICVDRGMLEFGKPGGVKGVNTLGDLTLRDAAMAYTNMGEGTYGFLKVCRTFTLAGSQPYDFLRSVARTSSCCSIPALTPRLTWRTSAATPART